MLHKELIQEYGIDVAKLPDSLQYAIREANVLEQEIGAMKPRAELIAPDAPASLFDVVFKPSVYGQKTLRQLINDGTVFAKGTHRLFGPLAFVLWDSERNYLTVNSAIWNHINLPDIGEYLGGAKPDVNYSDGEVDYAAMLQQLDTNILGNLVNFLKEHEAHLEAYLVGEEVPLWSLYDITKTFREALGEGFVKNGVYQDNIGMVDQDGWKAILYFSTNSSLFLNISVPDFEDYYINFKIESNGYLIPIRFKDSVRTIEAWDATNGYSPLNLEDVFDFAHAQLHRLKLYKVTDLNTEIEKMEMELGAADEREIWQMTYEEYCEKIWFDKNNPYGEHETTKALLYMMTAPRRLKEKEIKPKDLVGTGFKNPMKVALEYVDRERTKFNKSIETKGQSEYWNKYNYLYNVAKALLDDNTTVEYHVFESFKKLGEENPDILKTIKR